MPLYDITFKYLDPSKDVIKSEIVTVVAVNDDIAYDIALDHFENVLGLDFDWYEVIDVTEVTND